MRRAKAKLTVSTFPFLAVLLCAMGSLIMLLMVFDQRAKRAARQRNLQQAVEVARREEERWKKAQALVAEQEAQQEADHQEQLRKMRLEGERKLRELDEQAEKLTASEREALLGRIREEERIKALRGVTAEVERERERTRKEMASLRATLDQAQRDRLEREKQKGERKLALDKARQALAAEREAEQERLRRLSSELADLEKVLKQAEEKKEKSAQTFSIVPYKGKRGEDKRPIYVECTWNKLIFHPDKFALDPGDPRMGLMTQIEDRARAQNQRYVAAGLPPHPRPFLMLLVRPDGIPTYYQFQVAMKGQAVDFGYELIDQDWELDFPQEGPETLPPDRNQLARNHPGLTPGVDGGFASRLSGPVGNGTGSRGIPAGERGLQPGGTLAPGMGGGVVGGGPGGVPGALPGGLGSSGLGNGVRGFRAGFGPDGATENSQGIGGIANGPPGFPGMESGMGAGGPGMGTSPGSGLPGMNGNGPSGLSGTGGAGASASVGAIPGSGGVGGSGNSGSGTESRTGGLGGLGGNGPRIGGGGLAASGQGMAGASGFGGGSGGLAGLGTGGGAGLGTGGAPGVPGLPEGSPVGANPDGSIPGVIPTPQRIPGPTAPALGATGLTAPGSFGGLPGALPGGGDGALGAVPGPGGNGTGSAGGGASGPGVNGTGSVGGLPGNATGGGTGVSGKSTGPGGNSPGGGLSAAGSDKNVGAGGGIGEEVGASLPGGSPGTGGTGSPGNGAAGNPGSLPPIDGPPPAPSLGAGSAGAAGGGAGGLSVQLNPQEQEKEPAAAKLPRPSGVSSDGFPGVDDPAMEALNRLNIPLPTVTEDRPKAPRPLKMARLTGGRELTQYVECTADGVVLHPGGKKFTRQMISQPEESNPLLQELKERVERRRTLDRAAGTTSFIQVRFLVWPEGMRAYHALYPTVATWPVHSRQQTINNAKDLREALSSQ